MRSKLELVCQKALEVGGKSGLRAVVLGFLFLDGRGKVTPKAAEKMIYDYRRTLSVMLKEGYVTADTEYHVIRGTKLYNCIMELKDAGVTIDYVLALNSCLGRGKPLSGAREVVALLCIQSLGKAITLDVVENFDGHYEKGTHAAVGRLLRDMEQEGLLDCDESHPHRLEFTVTQKGENVIGSLMSDTIMRSH